MSSVRPPRALIVTHEPSLGGRLADALATQGLTATHAASAGQAISFLAQESFDVVLLQLELDARNALEVLYRARQRSDRLPLFVVTNGSNPRLLRCAEDYRLAAVFRRPANIPQIASRVMLALDPLYWPQTQSRKPAIG